MNDPNKRIDVNLSSLLSLKAELLRKQVEVNRFKKPNTSDPFAAFISKRHASSSSSRSHNKKKNEQPPPKSNAEKSENEKRADEDYEMLAKSKKILEAKAKLYNKMTSSGGSLNSDDTCLVRFNQKKQEERQPVDHSSSESESDTEDQRGGSDHDDDKWTEYTDCLGRTRKCLKEDLEFFKKKDLDLTDATRNRTTRSEEKETPNVPQTPWFVDTKGISSADLPLYKPTNDDDVMSMISKSSKMEEMRAQWEEKEQDNLNRENIHYQDVLFDEARTHGVGYYAFSVDAAEREKQQQVLDEQREKTLEEQRKREEVRLARERIVAERVFAAKNRQRARLGIAPMSREEFEAEKNKGKVEESKDDPKLKKKEEKEQIKKEKLEKEREVQRQKHLRPWDEGKDSVPRRRPSTSSDDEQWEYKPEKPEPMSQQQWNELKRTERKPEFAPVMEEERIQSFNRFTTKKPKPMKRRNETAYGNMFNEPIKNEMDGDDFPVEQDESNKRRRAEIAPPPTFDYYGPTSTTKPRSHGNNTDITASIEAGLKFLREKSDKIAPGSKQSWVANTTYEE
ncbi:coiled-coil domain-containing protein 174 [Sitodiplosis mosellana]|uniref:coiled-coil domain-containing protein 174 n=1 Tax=Sitodiplosis mosellana TaxID=263140 RepID=UPI0024439744|nr:coiled-coil domain-containing protein 174 [Sitodiplosis mosellana]